jgi:hypothetical protein
MTELPNVKFTIALTDSDLEDDELDRVATN